MWNSQKCMGGFLRICQVVDLYYFDALLIILSSDNLPIVLLPSTTLSLQCEVFAGMLRDLNVTNVKKRPKALEVTSQRDKLRHWLQVRFGGERGRGWV